MLPKRVSTEVAAISLASKESGRRRNTEEDDDFDYPLDGKIQLPIDKWKLPVNFGWECEQVIVRAVSGDKKAKRITHSLHFVL
ncbi:MAG: hypothetical protein ACM3WP_19765 [Acidobacteriota bacterium]